MERSNIFLVFFSIVLTVYGLINFHIFLRAWQVLGSGLAWRSAFAAAFWLVVISFPLGRMIENVSLNWLSTTLIWIGSFWLAFMAYLYLFVLLIDILRLANFIVPFFPLGLTKDPLLSGRVIAGVVFGVVLCAVILGHVNARMPRIKALDLAIPKTAPLDELRIVAVSDIHLGTLVCRRFFDSVVDQINKQNADIVLLVGDTIDEDIGPVVRQDLGKSLRQIKSRFGVFGVTGNHEFFGGVDATSTYLRDHGVVVLRDSSAVVGESLVLIGREDSTKGRLTGTKRKTLAELFHGIDRDLPILVMDHQPNALSDAVEQKADVQLSGHTHNGQLWPFNYIAEAVYEISWGYAKKGGTHFYVSSGLGTWGPPIRTGNVPEIVILTLRFNN